MQLFLLFIFTEVNFTGDKKKSKKNKKKLPEFEMEREMQPSVW